MSGEQSQPSEALITDQDYLIREYRVMLEILEAVKLGFTPREDLDAALDSFIKFKLPAKYLDKITPRYKLEAKYRGPFEGELIQINQRYQSPADRRREFSKIENDVKFNTDLDNLEEIKNLLEKEGIMNSFVKTRSGSVSAPNS